MKINLFFKIFLTLSFFPFLVTQAQLPGITITLDDLEYQDGEYYKMYSRDGSLWIVTGLTGLIGGPYTWDFSTGPTDSDYTFDYVLPSTTPCNSDFPLAAITEQKTGSGADPAYMYMDFQADTGRVNYGVCQPGTLPSSYVFNPPIIDFPSTINFMDNWIGNTTFPAESGGFILDVHYDFNAFCNGWGTLILPNGLGDSCLQVSYLEHYTFYWMGTPIQEFYIRSFYWIIPNAGIAVIMSSQEGTVPPPEDFDYSNIYSRMYESSKLNQSNEFSLDIKVFLEGPFNTSSGLMNTTLNPDDIPLSQPYNIPPWDYFGMESVLSIPSVDIVDWVLIELRDTTINSLATPESRIGRQAAFLLNDGSIVGIDGTSLPIFNVPVNNDLFTVVWHRNHLGIMSYYPLVKSDGIYSYDFTNDQNNAYGGTLAHKQIDLGIWGMFAGDANADYEINEDDKEFEWMLQSGTLGYKSSDFNMNKQVNNPDKNDFWFENSGSNCQVPQ